MYYIQENWSMFFCDYLNTCPAEEIFIFGVAKQYSERGNS